MKVLIISHNPITTYQNMGKTFLSLFSSFDKTELCQLYIYPTIPDVDVCNSYFRITDRDVVKSYMRFGKVNSRTIESYEIDTQSHCLFESEDEKAFLKKNKKTSLTLLCRDALWVCSYWYNVRLKHWLENEKPTCIFLAPGQSKFIYNIALRISKKLNIPVFTYICDDYYFVRNTEKGMQRIHFFLLKKKIKQLLVNSKAIITICDELSTAYHNEFGTKTQTICTGSSYPIAEKTNAYQKIEGLTFMGNCGCKRYLPLAEIGHCLDELNEENRTEYSLFLYTYPLDDGQKQAFSGIKSIKCFGYVTGPDFDRIFHSAHILLHVEAFDSDAIDRVKYSVSTKIADCLGSGNLLFAYGPAEVASIQHLIRNNCAKVVADRNELKSALREVLFGMCHQEIVNNALSVAKSYHVSEMNSLTLKTMINEKE